MEDCQIITIVSNQLQSLLDRVNILGFDKNEKWDNSDVFNQLLIECSGKHIVSLGDTFDDFCIRAYVQRDSFYFFWRLESSPFFTYSDYGNDVKSGVVSVWELKNVLSNFQKAISLI